MSTVKVLKAITIIYLIGLAIFTTSIIYSAVQMATDVDADVTDPEGRFLDTPEGTVYQIATNVTLKNSGFYDIDDLKITIGYESNNTGIKDEYVNDVGKIPGGGEKTEFTVQVDIRENTLKTLLIQDDNLTIWLKIEAKYVIFGATFEATLEDIEWEGVLNHFSVDVTPTSFSPTQLNANVTIYYNGSLDIDPTQLDIMLYDDGTNLAYTNVTEPPPLDFNVTFPVTLTITGGTLSSGMDLRFEFKLMCTVEGVEIEVEYTEVVSLS